MGFVGSFSYPCRMATYNRPATVIRADGTEFPVTANLTSFTNGLRPGWGGTLNATPAELKGLLNGHRARLRLETGYEAIIHLADTSTAAVFGYLAITSEGDVPF
jgi:hypothetical protein